MPSPNDTNVADFNVVIDKAASAEPPLILKPEAGHTLIVLADVLPTQYLSPGAASAGNVGP